MKAKLIRIDMLFPDEITGREVAQFLREAAACFAKKWPGEPGEPSAGRRNVSGFDMRTAAGELFSTAAIHHIDTENESEVDQATHKSAMVSSA